MAQFQIDLTDVSDEGFAVVPPGRYRVEAEDWVYYIKGETLNPVIRMKARIVEGDYKDETVAHFCTVSGNRISKQNYMRQLRAFGILRDGDRGKDRQLATSLDLNEPNERGESPIKFVIVNGDRRPVKGTALAVVTWLGSDQAKSSVDRFEAIPQHDAGSAPSFKHIAEDDVPF